MDNEYQNTTERRSSVRLTEFNVVKYFAVKYSELFGGAKPRGSASITKNISSGGLCFQSAALLDVGSVLRLEISMPDLAKYRNSFTLSRSPTLVRLSASPTGSSETSAASR